MRSQLLLKLPWALHDRTLPNRASASHASTMNAKPLASMVFVLSIAATSCFAQESKDVVGAAWDHFNNGTYDAGLAFIDKALATLDPQAKKEAAAMRGFDAPGHERDHGAANAAGTMLLIRARILEKRDGESAALPAYQRVVTEFPFAQAWDPGGWFWHPAEDAKKRSYTARLKSAIAARNLGESFFPAREDALDFPAQRDVVQALAIDLLGVDDLAALEVLFESARRHRIRFSNGDWMIHTLYRGIDTPTGDHKTDEDWGRWRERLQRWHSAHPKSVTPKIAEAGFMVHFAWKARGSGVADKVDPEAWPVFKERLADAAKLLFETPRECPEWYDKMLIVGLAQSWERDAYNKIFDEGWKKWPDYVRLVENKAYYLLPRWHGEAGEWQRFAAEFARKHGAEYYPIAVRYASLFEGEAAFKDIDRELLRRGWEIRIRQRPGSLSLLHGYARTLARIGDPHAKTLFDKLGDTYQMETWSSYSSLEATRRNVKLLPAK